MMKRVRSLMNDDDAARLNYLNQKNETVKYKIKIRKLIGIDF